MKFVFLLLIMFVIPSVFSQNNTFLRVGFNANINVYAPYTSKLNNVKSPYEIKSNTLNANIDFRIYQLKKFSFYLGMVYKKIKYTKFDAISSFNYWNYITQANVIYTFSDPADLIAKSNSLGTAVEISFTIRTTERYRMILSTKPTIYFLESFGTQYVSTDTIPQAVHSFDQQLNSLQNGFTTSFFLSSINSQLIYRVTLLPKKGRTTIAGRVSFGANIFSDWEQFKRYAWIGVGLEIVFLNKKKE